MLGTSSADPVGLRVFSSGDSIAHAGAIVGLYPFYTFQLDTYLHCSH